MPSNWAKNESKNCLSKLQHIRKLIEKKVEFKVRSNECEVTFYVR